MVPQEALATSTREGVGKMVATTVAATTGAAAVVSAQLSSVDERFQVGALDLAVAEAPASRAHRRAPAAYALPSAESRAHADDLR